MFFVLLLEAFLEIFPWFPLEFKRHFLPHTHFHGTTPTLRQISTARCRPHQPEKQTTLARRTDRQIQASTFSWTRDHTGYQNSRLGAHLCASSILSVLPNTISKPQSHPHQHVLSPNSGRTPCWTKGHAIHQKSSLQLEWRLPAKSEVI